MALQLLDSVISVFDNSAPLSAADVLVQKILNGNASKWSTIIGDRTIDGMKKETATKYDSNKESSNSRKRLDFIQTLFKQYTDGNKKDESDEKDDIKEDNKNDEAMKPIDDLLKISRGESKFNDELNLYTVSAQADLGLDCNFELNGDGKWLYEVELLSDPNKYDSINIGYA
eukprot:250393_1